MEAEATHKQGDRIQVLDSRNIALIRPGNVHFEGLSAEVDEGDVTQDARQTMSSDNELNEHTDRSELHAIDTTGPCPDTIERSRAKACLSIIAGAVTIVAVGTAWTAYCKPDWLSWVKPSKQVWS